MLLFGRKNMRAEDLRELIVWLRANPNTASAGFGGGDSHLVTAFFQKVVGAQVALVPYRGSAPAMQDLVAGHIGTFDGRALRSGITEGGRGVKPVSPCPCASRWAAYARSRESAEKAEPPVATAAMTASISKRFMMPSAVPGGVHVCSRL